MDAKQPLPADLYAVLDHLSRHDQVPQALALAEKQLQAHPREIPLLAWQGWLLSSLRRGDEAMQAYQRQQAIILTEEPRTPHRWQHCGFSLYEQARAARVLGRPEARNLMAEALTRIGDFIDHPAWFEAGEWAWMDGDHDTAGRLWHHLLLKGCGRDSIAPRIAEICASLGDAHSCDWVWLARMRSQLGAVPGLDRKEQQARIERHYAHVAHHPMAWRLRARARQMAGDLAGASADLDRYLAQAADPGAQVFRCALDHEMGRPHGLEALEWSRDASLGGTDYYAAGCDLGGLVQRLREEGQYSGIDDLKRAQAVEARAYLLGAARFERYFATGEGNSQDADPHVYAMLCNNLGIVGCNAQEKYEEGIAWHDKGWAVSPFWEQSANRLECQFHARRWAGVIESFETLRGGAWPGWDPSTAAFSAAWSLAQLGRHDDVLALHREFAEDPAQPFEAAIVSVDAESRQAGLMALAAASAAALGDRDTLARLSERLLASDRLSRNLSERLAEAWLRLGDCAASQRFAQAWIGTDPPLCWQAPRFPTTEALQAMAEHSAFVAHRHGPMLLRAGSPQGWQFELQAGGVTDNGIEVPLCIDAQQGSEPDRPVWRTLLYREPAGLFGRLRGRSHAHSLRFVQAAQGVAAADGEAPSPAARWMNSQPGQIPEELWPELCRRFAVAEAAWRQLAGTVTLPRVQALLDRLAAGGIDPGATLDLGLCRIARGSGRGGISHWLELLFDHATDGDAAQPPSAFDPYSFRYEIVCRDPAPYLIYVYQDREAASIRQIGPGDVERVRDSHASFLRLERRFERWAAAQLALD